MNFKTSRIEALEVLEKYIDKDIAKIKLKHDTR